MRALFHKLAWKIRGRKRVRLHFLNRNESVEGVLVGVWAGHYVLKLARLLHDADTSESLEGDIEVPVERVFFLQRLA